MLHQTGAERQAATVAKRLALAHHIAAQIEAGVYDDQADVARQHGLTRARLTQLMNLLLLAPDIQEEILALEVPAGRQPLSERSHALGRALTPAERDELVLSSSLEVRTATAFGELIIAIVYLPILTLEGIEGKMFRPMALTVVFALAGAFVLSITLAPVLASLMLPLHPKESEGRVMTALRNGMARALDVVLRHRVATVSVV